MLDTKSQLENLPAEPAKIIEILIMDAQSLQRYYGTMLAKSLNGDHAHNIKGNKWAVKFNQCNELIDHLSKLR